MNSNLRFKFKIEEEENEIKKKRLHLALWTNFFSPAHSPYSRSPVLHPCARLRQTLAAMWAHATSHTPAARTNLGTMHLGSPLRLTVGPSAKLHVPTLCVASLPVGPPYRNHLLPPDYGELVAVNVATKRMSLPDSSPTDS